MKLTAINAGPTTAIICNVIGYGAIISRDDDKGARTFRADVHLGDSHAYMAGQACPIDALAWALDILG